MLNLQRQREERRERIVGDPASDTAGGTAGATVDYYSAVDNLISATISSDSEAFNQQIEQENGQ